jgi:hypothetical protein
MFLRNPETAISFHEISGKRSKSWEDNTRTRKAASLPRCGRVKSNKYAELKGSDEDSRAGLLPCFFFAFCLLEARRGAKVLRKRSNKNMKKVT